MLRKRLAPPTTQRSFTSGWGELEYLCGKIRYWLYDRKDRGAARRFAGRLDQLLRSLPADELAILRQEGLALKFELNGKLKDSIAHRKREVELMERLLRDAQSAKYSDATRAYMLQSRDHSDLRRRREIIANLEAIATHGIDTSSR
jgi:hypothetical protein